MKRVEQALQRQVATFMDAAYPTLVWFHCPNGGGRSPVEGAILKTMGVKPGVPDITLILPTGLCAFIELKAGKGKLTPSQEAFRDKVRTFGCLWAEARSLPEVEGTLDAWLRPLGYAAKARIAA